MLLFAAPDDVLASADVPPVDEPDEFEPAVVVAADEPELDELVEEPLPEHPIARAAARMDGIRKHMAILKIAARTLSSVRATI